MRGRLASAAAACVMTMLASGAPAAQSAVESPQLGVCLSLSPKVSVSARGAAVVWLNRT